MGQISKAQANNGAVSTNKGISLKYSDEFASSLGGIWGYLGTTFEVAANGGSFIGLDYQKVEPIRTAIREYVQAIQEKLSELNTEASTSNALKGDIAVAATNYVKAVSDVAKAYVSSLLSYSDKMYEYGTQMATNDQTLKKEVDDESKSLTNKTETYTEQHTDAFKAVSSGGVATVGTGIAAAAAAVGAAAANSVK